MSLIKSRTFKWNQPTVSDVVSHNVYVVPKGQTLNYSSTFVNVPMPQCSYSLPGAFDMQLEQDYQVGVGAVDGIGNISDIAVIESFFDLVPPSKPVGLVIE